MQKKQLILNSTINFLIFISILFASLNVSYSSSLTANNPNENERNLLVPNQNQINDGGCEKIGEFDDYYGVYEDVFVDGSIAYIVSESEGLYIYDVSNYNNPTILGTWGIENETLIYKTLFIASGYAYMIDSLGFSIIDISSPSSPTFVGYYPSTNNLIDIFIDGDYAYICVSPNGLHIIDISDKTNPSYVGGCSIINLQSVYIEGNIACVAGISEGLVTVNITDKVNPVKLDNMYFSSTSVGVCINDDLAYLAAMGEGVYIHDISDPTSIGLLTQFNHPTLSDNANDVEVSNDLIYVSNGNSFYILNETTLEGNFTNGAYGPLSVEGDFAYFIEENVGCQILNITNSTAIELVNVIYSGGSHRSVFVEGNYAYVALHGFGLGIYDISDPQNPTKISAFRYNSSGQPSPNYLVVQDDYAYLAGGPGLVIVDVHDKNNPIGVSYYDEFQVRSVAVQGNYAFIVGNFERLQILDISDPANIIEVSNLTMTFDYCACVVVEGNYAYISVQRDGDLMIVDISYILSPTIVSTTGIGQGSSSQLSVSGNYVSVAMSYDLVTFDTSDKANPVEVSRLDYSTDRIHSNGTITCGVGIDIALNGYVIRVYDTSDKTNPTLIASYYDESEFGDIFLYNNHIFAANLLNGFIVIGFVEITPTTNGFGLNFLAVFIMTTFVFGYRFAKRKKRK